jgi:poly(glycerol-phosphate) alpha-glucosyltransferase
MGDSTITPVILSNSLDIVRGGLTKAVFTRANTLAKAFTTVYIFTFSFQQNHKEIINQLYKEGLLDRKVKVLNLFEDLNPNHNKKRNNSKKTSVKEKGLTEFKDKKQIKSPSYRYYKNGLYVQYKRFDGNGNLVFIDYMDESRHRIRREEFNKNGFLVRTRQMDRMLNTPRLDRYFDNTGKCYLTAWINPKTNKEGRTITFNKIPKEYESLSELSQHWVEDKLKAIKYPVLMTDKRNLDMFSLQIKHKNLKRVAVIHNNHFKKPYDTTAQINESYKPLFENLNQFHGVVFLTDEQKKDVENLYGKQDSFFVIPHPAKQVNNSKGKNFIDEYNPNLAVSLARYQGQKRLDEAIRAFKFVVDKIPEAEYHIFGFGKEKDKLNQLIKDLGLENNVKLKGYTSDSSYTYKTAACSILTSDYEGFGMVLTESLASGTPVVSYDSKYGPSDIIRDGKDGYLVEKGNQKQLAEKIINIMNNKELREKLSKNTIEVNDRFSVDDYANSWIKVLSNL